MPVLDLADDVIRCGREDVYLFSLGLLEGKVCKSG